MIVSHVFEVVSLRGPSATSLRLVGFYVSPRGPSRTPLSLVSFSVSLRHPIEDVVMPRELLRIAVGSVGYVVTLDLSLGLLLCI